MLQYAINKYTYKVYHKMIEEDIENRKRAFDESIRI